MLFVFDSNYASISAMPAIELVYLLKTTDGGKTWNVKQYQDPPSVGGRDYIEGAHFFTDQIGFFMARLWSFDDLVDRTYWTFDGGNTWELMSPIQYPDLKTALGADKYNYSTEIADLELIDDTYYMTVIIRADGYYSFDGDYFLCVKYASKDLKNWTLVTGNNNDLDSNQNEPSAFYKYEEETGTKVYLQIDAWNQTLTLPFSYDTDIEKFWILYDATIVGNKGFFVYRPDNDETSIKILSFTKGSDEITEQTIAWDEAICQNQIFCDFIDDENGYIFVTEEIDAPGFSRGAEKVAKLYKTHDGGKTWVSVNCDNIPYISLRYSLILAKFVTEDIGIIAGHLGPDDFNFHERTYITKDGGLSWIPVDLSNFADLFAYQVLDIEAYDLQYTNGTYYLYVEDRGEPTPEGVSKPCYLFTSTDGVEWNYLEKVN